MKYKKVLFILPTLHAGGAENYTLRFIKTYKDKYDFHVLSVNTNKGDLHNEFINAGAKVFYKSISYFNILKFYSFYKLVKKHNIDTVGTFNGNFGGMPLFIARLAGVKNRIALYRRSTNAFGNNFFKLLYNNLGIYLVRKNATTILSNSIFAFKNFHGAYYLNDRRYKVISNGIDTAGFKTDKTRQEARKVLGLPESMHIVGHVGRYDPAKNHKTIFNVIKIIRETNTDIKFVFCGKNTDGQAFKNELVKYGIQDNVISLGIKNDIPLVLKSFNQFYFPSVTEGQPNALIEAMVIGLPVTVSNIEPILEALPETAHIHAIAPLDAYGAVKSIMNIYNSGENIGQFVHKDWSVKKFNHAINFQLFENILQNG